MFSHFGGELGIWEEEGGEVGRSLSEAAYKPQAFHGKSFMFGDFGGELGIWGEEGGEAFCNRRITNYVTSGQSLIKRSVVPHLKHRPGQSPYR